MGVCVITSVGFLHCCKKCALSRSSPSVGGKKTRRDALVMIVQLDDVSLPKSAPLGDGRVASVSSLSVK